MSTTPQDPIIAAAATPSRPPELYADEAVDPCNHVANAIRIARRYGAGLCYIEGVGWAIRELRDDGHPAGPWRVDEAAARRVVQGLGNVVRDESQDAITKAAQCVDADSRAAWDSYAKHLLHWARQSEARNHIAASLDLARVRLARPAEEFDADPWLLGCPNGVLDLRAGKLRPYRLADRITKVAGCAFDAKADAPRWRAFVAEVFANDAALIAWWRRFVGYCLTASRTLHLLPVCWGNGANGKSTMLNTLQALLGEYAATAAPDLLIEQRNPQHEEAIAELRGKRLVVAIETGERGKLNESRVKHLTGGDRISARAMYRDRIEFLPSHQLLMATNHKPSVQGTDDAIWRRLRLVPFARQFSGSKRDTRLGDKLRAELPGILCWALAGLADYRKHGDLGTTPKAIEAATNEYRSDEDVIGQFIEECCVTSAGARTYGPKLYQCYRAWCESQNAHPRTAHNFGKLLKDRGCRVEIRGTRNKWWVGIDLAPTAPGPRVR